MIPNQAEKQDKHYDKKNKVAIVIVLILFFIIIFIFTLNNRTKKIEYTNTQILLDNSNITNNLEKNIINENEKIYMSFNDVKKYLDNTVFWEEDTQTLITTSEKKLTSIKKGEGKININGSDVKIDDPIIEKEDIMYIAISEMKNAYDYDFEFIEKSNIAVIDSLNKEKIEATAKKNIKLREEDKFFSKIIQKINKDEKVYVIKNESKKALIRSSNGNIGYVNSKYLYNILKIRDTYVDENENEISDTSKIYEYDLTSNDITTFKKRQDIINIILQQAVKSDKIFVKAKYNKDDNVEFDRFKIESKPILKECGINIYF